jgi:hypothetical protein
MPARLLLLCLLFRSSWLTVEGRPVTSSAAGVLHRRGGRAAVAVRVGVAPGVPERNRQCRGPTCCSVGAKRERSGGRSGRPWLLLVVPSSTDLAIGWRLRNAW